jgi:hypothetical protein
MLSSGAPDVLININHVCGRHSGHLGAGGSDAAMLSAASLCALAMTSASVRTGCLAGLCSNHALLAARPERTISSIPSDGRPLRMRPSSASRQTKTAAPRTAVSREDTWS